MNDFEYEPNEFPIGYLITIRSYGTWLHGDERGSMNRVGYHRYGGPKISPNLGLEKSDASALKERPVIFFESQRVVIERAIREVCRVRGYLLQAINVRTNHVHIVVAAASKPETLMNAFKAYATRDLRESGLISTENRIWSRHGSTRYLWKLHHIDSAIDYVINAQDY